MFRLRARRDGIVATHTDGRFNGMCKRMFYKPTKIRHGTRTGIIGNPRALPSITDRAAVIFDRARRPTNGPSPRMFSEMQRIYIYIYVRHRESATANNFSPMDSWSGINLS